MSFLNDILSVSDPTVNKNLLGLCKKDQIKGFLDNENCIYLESLPVTFPSKNLGSINYETDGIVFEIEICKDSDSSFTMMIFMDLSEKSLFFVESGKQG